MIESMTGYGSHTVETQTVRITVDVRSLNSRFLDLSVRLSEGLESLEERVRRKAREECQRGRISVFVSVDPQFKEMDGNLEIDRDRFEAYLSLIDTIEREYGQKMDVSTIVDIKELIVDSRVRKVDPEVVLEALSRALAELKAMRLAEGKVIAEDLGGRMETLRVLLDGIRSISEESLLQTRDTYARRIRELASSGEVVVDDGRILQEAAILTEKMDVTEECVRCASHLGQFEKLIESKNPVGKRMNFVLQEITREVNTIGSKTGRLEIVQKVIDMKNEVEKLKEQIQNVV